MLKVKVDRVDKPSLVTEGNVLRRLGDNQIFMVIKGKSSGKYNLLKLTGGYVGDLQYNMWTERESLDLTGFELVDAELKVKF